MRVPIAATVCRSRQQLAATPSTSPHTSCSMDVRAPAMPLTSQVRTVRAYLAKLRQAQFGTVKGHRRLYEYLQQEIERARYFDRCVAVLMVRAARRDVDPPSRW